jgi:hypothetical protein
MDGWGAQYPENLQGTENDDDGDECDDDDRKNGKVKMLKQTNICNMIRMPKKKERKECVDRLTIIDGSCVTPSPNVWAARQKYFC